MTGDRSTCENRVLRECERKQNCLLGAAPDPKLSLSGQPGRQQPNPAAEKLLEWCLESFDVFVLSLPKCGFCLPTNSLL